MYASTSLADVDMVDLAVPILWLSNATVGQRVPGMVWVSAKVYSV